MNYTISYVQNVIKCTSMKLFNPDFHRAGSKFVNVDIYYFHMKIAIICVWCFHAVLPHNAT